MDSIETYIEEHGLDALLDEVEAVRKDNKPLGRLAEDGEVDEDDWFAFLRRMNNTMSPTYHKGPIAVPPFNYLKARRLAVSFVEERTGPGSPYDGVEYGDIVAHVAAEVDADEEQVSAYLEAGEFEELDDGRIAGLSFR